MLFEFFLGSQTTELQDLGSVEGATSNNNFFPGPHHLEFSIDRSVVATIGCVHGLALEVLNAVGLRLGAVGRDQHLGGEAVGAEGEGVQGRAVRLLGREGLGDVVPGAAPTAVLVDVQGHLIDALDLVAVGVGAVHVTLHALRDLVCVGEGDVFGVGDGILADAQDAGAVNDVGDVVKTCLFVIPGSVLVILLSYRKI